MSLFLPLLVVMWASDHGLCSHIWLLGTSVRRTLCPIPNMSSPYYPSSRSTISSRHSLVEKFTDIKYGMFNVNQSTENGFLIGENWIPEFKARLYNSKCAQDHSLLGHRGLLALLFRKKWSLAPNIAILPIVTKYDRPSNNLLSAS